MLLLVPWPFTRCLTVFSLNNYLLWDFYGIFLTISPFILCLWITDNVSTKGKEGSHVVDIKESKKVKKKVHVNLHVSENVNILSSFNEALTIEIPSSLPFWANKELNQRRVRQRHIWRVLTPTYGLYGRFFWILN